MNWLKESRRRRNRREAAAIETAMHNIMLCGYDPDADMAQAIERTTGVSRNPDESLTAYMARACGVSEQELLKSLDNVRAGDGPNVGADARAKLAFAAAAIKAEVVNGE